MTSTSTPDWLREKLRRYWGSSRQLLGTISRYQRCKVESEFLAMGANSVGVKLVSTGLIVVGIPVKVTGNTRQYS